VEDGHGGAGHHASRGAAAGPTPRHQAAAARGTAAQASAVCAGLVLAVAIVFGQTLRYPLINFDDHQYVSQNKHVTDGLTRGGIAWAFTHFYASNWHPLAWLSHMLDCQCYDGIGWPGGHHLTSVLLHALTAVLLFLVLRQMTGRLWPSALAAAVFALHPLRVESVAWVSERKDVLSGLLFVLTLWAYVRYVRRPFSLGRYLAVAAFFALGLMAKPMLVTLPAVLLLLDYWPLERAGKSVSWRWLLLEKLPLLALSVASSVMTLLAQRTAMKTTDDLSFSARIANALVAYTVYLRQMVCPTGLAVFYPHPRDGLPAWEAAGAAVLLAAITAVVLARRQRQPYLLVGWLWYLGMLVPVIGLLQVGDQAMADRYTYLPQIGICLVLAWAAADAAAHLGSSARACGGWATIVLAVMTAAAWQQTTYWRDSEALWYHALDCTSQNYMAHYNLACALQHHGAFPEAAAHYKETLEITPHYAPAHVNLGELLADHGRLAAAMDHYRQALQAEPDNADAHNNLGRLLARLGQSDEAIAHFQRALATDPDCAEAHNNLGNELAARGEIAAASGHFQRALDLDPGFVQVHNNIGVMLAGQGRLEEAIAHYQEALRVKPGYAAARINLGRALADCGRLDESIACYRKALELEPASAPSHVNLAAVLARQGKRPDALAHLREAARLSPDDGVVLSCLAWTLATSPDGPLRNGAEAVAVAQRAARLSGGREPSIQNTLAAAYAEAGRFPEAVQTAADALALAAARKNNALAAGLRARLKLYAAGSPCRDNQDGRSPNGQP
jgi:tetratricopeptide (TPR) repeat protein